MRKIAVACVIVFVAACEGPTGPTRPTVDARISGRVLDSATNEGVPSVTVAFEDATTVTGTDGSYSLVVQILTKFAYFGRFAVTVDGRGVGSARVTGPGYRGDFLIYPPDCIARYGTVTDARTFRPIIGATVALSGRRVVTEVDGWYRLDLGCPTDYRGGNTTFIYISHPRYVTYSQVTGRGVFGAVRADYELRPE